jgi:N-acetylneuraminate synthase
MPSFKIGNIRIGDNCPPVIIVELGINHNGNLDNAIALADSAIKSGAEILKHQTHIPDDEMSQEAKKIYPVHATQSIYNIIKKCALSENNERKLMNYIKQKKKIFISTPFSRKAADRLKKFNVPAYKIGSGECNNYHFVEYICKFKKPIIMSTGMNTLDSIKKSVLIIRKYKIPFALLHCVNLYPTPSELTKIECLFEIKKAYPDAVVGLSDHTTNIYSCLGSVALGSRVIEKHFVDNKVNRRGPDVSSSMDSSELKQLIYGSKIIFNSLGKGKYPDKREKKTSKFAFQSVVSTDNIKKNQLFTKKNIFLRRPGNGDFNVNALKTLYGKRASRDIENNRQIRFLDVKKN